MASSEYFAVLEMMEYLKKVTLYTKDLKAKLTRYNGLIGAPVAEYEGLLRLILEALKSLGLGDATGPILRCQSS